MSAAAQPTTTAAAPPAPPPPLEVYRDDGPLARALAALGPVLRLPATLLLAIALVPLLVAIAADGDGASHGLAAAVVAWLVVAGGASRGRPLTDPMRWAIPPLLRLGEYAAVLWLAALAGGAALPAAFALLCAAAFRHYDLVYRLRHRGVTPPAWVDAVTLGWDGRLILAWALLAAGALAPGLYVAAGLLAAVCVGESVAGWARFERAHRPALYEDDEEEGE